MLLKTRDGDEVELTAQEFREIVNHTSDKDYERKYVGERVRIDLPQEAIIKEYEKTTLLATPTNSEYKGYSYYLPNSVIRENTEKEDGSVYANLGEDFTVNLRKGEEEIKLSAKEYAALVNGATATYGLSRILEQPQYRPDAESFCNERTVPPRKIAELLRAYGNQGGERNACVYAAKSKQ